MKLKELYITPNLLSLSRFIIAILAAFILLKHFYILAVLLIVIIWITDILDGYIARTRNEITELGKIIDPVADKFTIILISIVLLYQEILPVWFFIPIVLRDILILTGGIYLKKSRQIVLMSDWIGKVAVFFIGLTIISNIFLFYTEKTAAYNLNLIKTLELINNVLIFITLVMLTFSLANYFRRFINKVKM